MAGDCQLLGDGDRHFVDPLEPRPEKDRQPLLLMAPEFFVIDEPARRLQQPIDLQSAHIASAEPLRRFRQRFAQPDRVLADFATGRMRRQID